MDGSVTGVKPGDALIASWSCFPDLEGLRNQFDIVQFLDLCAGIEAAVLHETLFTFEPLKELDAIDNSVARALLGAGTLCQVERPTVDNEAQRQGDAQKKYLSREAMPILGAFIRQGAKLAKLFETYPYVSPSEFLEQHVRMLWLTRIYHATDKVMSGIVDESQYQVPLVVPASHLPAYLNLSDRREHKAFQQLQGSLAKTYADYRKCLHELVQEVEQEEIIRIPPIAFEALSQAQNCHKLGESVLEMRDKYRKVREQFARLDEILRSEDVPFREKMKTKAKMGRAISKLFTTEEVDGICVMTSFAREINDAAGVDALLKDPDPSSVPWMKLVGFLIEKGLAAYWKFRLKPLHATKRRYLDASRRQIRDVISRHFDHEVSQDDVAVADMYLRIFERLLARPEDREALLQVLDQQDRPSGDE